VELSGRNALVTGGGSGIGLACARRLLSDGATVTLAGRSEARLRAATASLIEDAPDGAGVRWVACDVTDEADVAAAVARADTESGLSIVVASAGTGWVEPVTTLAVASYRKVIDTNLTGTFLTLKHTAPRIAGSGGGAFTAISSVAGTLTTRFLAPYCAAKAGVDMLVRSAADELGHLGVRVNSVQPGLVPTELSEALVEDASIRADWVEQMPLGRLGMVDDVAAAVRFLSGSGASWITGVCVPVDGGNHLRRGPNLDPYVERTFGSQWLP
jgi:NAD(P)-dependent dehydrogenase (short-subunit alcohol dehydrogenase family)